MSSSGVRLEALDCLLPEVGQGVDSGVSNNTGGPGFATLLATECDQQTAAHPRSPGIGLKPAVPVLQMSRRPGPESLARATSCGLVQDPGVIPLQISGPICGPEVEDATGLALCDVVTEPESFETQDKPRAPREDSIPLGLIALAVPRPTFSPVNPEGAVQSGDDPSVQSGRLDEGRSQIGVEGSCSGAELVATSDRDAVFKAIPGGVPIGGSLRPTMETEPSAGSLPPIGVGTGLAGMRSPTSRPGSVGSSGIENKVGLNPIPDGFANVRPLENGPQALRHDPIASGLIASAASPPTSSPVNPEGTAQSDNVPLVPAGRLEGMRSQPVGAGSGSVAERLATSDRSAVFRADTKDGLKGGSLTPTEVSAVLPSVRGTLPGQASRIPSMAPGSLANAVEISGMPTPEAVAFGSVSVRETSKIVLAPDGTPRSYSTSAMSGAPDSGRSATPENSLQLVGAEERVGPGESMDRLGGTRVPSVESTAPRPLQVLGRVRSSPEARGVPHEQVLSARVDEVATSTGLRRDTGDGMPDRPESLSRAVLSPESDPRGSRRNPVGTPEESTSRTVAATPFGTDTLGGGDRQVPEAPEMGSRPSVRSEIPQGESIPRRMEIETLGQGRLQLTLTQQGTELRIDARELGNALSGTETGWQDLQKRLEGAGVILSTLESATQDSSSSGGRNPHDPRHAACYNSGMNFSDHQDSPGNPKARRATPARDGTADSDTIQRGAGVASPGGTRARGREWWA